MAVEQSLRRQVALLAIAVFAGKLLRVRLEGFVRKRFE
jgi:hypothetical protein